MSVRLSFSSPPSPPLPPSLPSYLASNQLPQPNALTHSLTITTTQPAVCTSLSLPPSTSIKTKIYLVYVIGVIARGGALKHGHEWLLWIKSNSRTHPRTYNYYNTSYTTHRLYEFLPPSLPSQASKPNIHGLCDWSHSIGGGCTQTWT